MTPKIDNAKRQAQIRQQLAEFRRQIVELRKLQERLAKEFPDGDDPGYITKKIQKIVNSIGDLEAELITG